MEELFIILNVDTNQYYHSLTPRGYPLWTNIEETQYLDKSEADNIVAFIYSFIGTRCEVRGI